MPPPADLLAMGLSAHRAPPIQLTVANPHGVGGRATLQRTFHVYLELTMQCKHDAALSGYCRRLGVVTRATAGTQVNHGTTAELALAGYYTTRARSADMVAWAAMTVRWNQPQVAMRPTFERGRRYDAAMQRVVQPDGHRHEVSYWYDGDEVYVLYHAYPA